MSPHLNRRELLVTASALTVATAIGLRPAGGAEPATVNVARTISWQPELYAGWPTVTRGKDGRLWLAWSGGREGHVCPFGRVELMTSNDEGKTWTWPQVVLDGPLDDRDAGILETPSGALLISTFTSLAYEPSLQAAEAKAAAGSPTWPPERLARWQAARDRLTPAERQADLGVWMIRSTDGGVTWSPRYDCLVNSPHGPLALADGRLLYPGKELWKQPQRIGVAESTDDGKSWRWLAEIPTRAGDNVNEYHELHACQASDGRIVVHIRNHNPKQHHETLQSESTDGGKTWSLPHSIGVWGFPSHLLRLKDGRLVMSYGHRRAPLGNQARVSSDHGQTWSDPIVLNDDSVSTDVGYPSTVELSDGTLLTVWYEKRKEQPLAVLRQVTWQLK